MKLINIDKDIVFEININNTVGEWIEFTGKLITPCKTIIIEKDINATINVNEVKVLQTKISNLYKSCVERRDYRISFCCMEAYFEMIMENISIDELVEVEVWLNMGAITNGKVFGYDDGTRFVIDYNTVKGMCIELTHIFEGN